MLGKSLCGSSRTSTSVWFCQGTALTVFHNVLHKIGARFDGEPFLSQKVAECGTWQLTQLDDVRMPIYLCAYGLIRWDFTRPVPDGEGKMLREQALGGSQTSYSPYAYLSMTQIRRSEQDISSKIPSQTEGPAAPHSCNSIFTDSRIALKYRTLTAHTIGSDTCRFPQ